MVITPPSGKNIQKLCSTVENLFSKYSSQWIFKDEDQDILLKGLSNLKEVLNEVKVLNQIEPGIFIAPFLEIIKSEETTGPVTSLALASLKKFLSYGLIGKQYSIWWAFFKVVLKIVCLFCRCKSSNYSTLYRSNCWWSYTCKICWNRFVQWRSCFGEDYGGFM